MPHGRQLKDDGTAIVHLVAPDTPPWRLETVRTLICQRDDFPRRLVAYGCARAALRQFGIQPDVCLPLGPLWRRWADDRLIDAVACLAPRAFVHCWSRIGLRAHFAPRLRLWTQTPPQARWLVESDALCPLSHSRPRRAHYPGVQTLAPPPSDHQGAPAISRRTAIVAPPHPAPIRSPDRTAARRTLNLPPHAAIILLAPPLERDNGTLQVVWAWSILRRVRPDALLLCLTPPDDAARHLALIRAAHNLPYVRILYKPAHWRAAIDAADVFIVGDRAPVRPELLYAAASAGVPWMLPARDALQAWLGADSAFWCASRRPRSIARTLLDALEQRERAASSVDAARQWLACAPTAAAFGARMQQVYANLTAAKPVSAGLSADPG